MIGQPWQVAGGEVRVAIDEAEWWGAALAVLRAAVHQPRALVAALPEIDPVRVAGIVLAEVAHLYAAAAIAGAQRARPGSGVASAWVWVGRVGAEIVFAPAADVANLARCLEVFAIAVLEPSSPQATVARGATACEAAAWSADIGNATETLGGGPPGEGRIRSDPSAVDGVQRRRAAPDHRNEL